MNDLLGDLRRVLVRDAQTLAKEIELFPDDAMVWRTLPGVTNSAGTLALHIAGNLKHYVGALLGGTGYVRDRPAEFSRRDLPRTTLVRELTEAAEVVQTTLTRLAPDTLAAPFPERVANVTLSTQRFLLHLAVHLTFHLGQASYLRRVLTGNNQPSGAVSVAALAD